MAKVFMMCDPRRHTYQVDTPVKTDFLTLDQALYEPKVSKAFYESWKYRFQSPYKLFAAIHNTVHIAVAFRGIRRPLNEVLVAEYLGFALVTTHLWNRPLDTKDGHYGLEFVMTTEHAKPHEPVGFSIMSCVMERLQSGGWFRYVWLGCDYDKVIAPGRTLGQFYEKFGFQVVEQQ